MRRALTLNKWCCALFSVLVSSAATAATTPPATIDYEVRREHDAQGDRFVVTLRFRGDRDGRTPLFVPSTWADARNAERGVVGLRVLTPGTRLEDTDDPGVRRIVHRPGARLTVRYALTQIVPGELAAAAETHYLPIVQPDHFQWIGWTAWVAPAHDDQRVRVRVVFRDLPADWNFASSFGTDPAHIVFDGRLHEFRGSLFVGGHIRLRSRTVRGATVITAIRGTWPFRDGALADRIATMVDGERAFWGDNDRHGFLVSLQPLVAPAGGRLSNGTGLTRSFATFVTPGWTLADLDFLWVHEFFHHWNNRALGRFPEPRASMYWFSEGFTDYYTHLLMLRWGWITLDDYARAYDRILSSLSGSRERTTPNAAIAARFFSEPRTIGKLPYWRGMLLAARWDAEIRARSDGRRSLDDAMRALRRDGRGGRRTLDADRIVKTMAVLGVRDAAGDIAREIERGEPSSLAENALTPCIALESTREARYDPGFDLDASTRGTTGVTGVDPSGPAYAAGLRDGQRLRSARGGGRVDVAVELVVQDDYGAPTRTLRYLPAGAPFERQGARMKSDLDDAVITRCLRALGAQPPFALRSRSP